MTARLRPAGRDTVKGWSVRRQQPVKVVRHRVPMTTTCTSEEHYLIDALRRGDKDAMAHVYARHAGRVFETARRVVLDRQAAEDVTQDVFVHLWRHADRVDLDRGELRAFLVTVARRRAIDHVRSETSRRCRDERVASRDGAQGRRATEPDIADYVVAQHAEAERIAAVQRALERLPEAQRASVELAYYSGCSLREVAMVMHVPEGTAKSRVRQALRRMERQLAEGAVTASR